MEWKQLFEYLEENGYAYNGEIGHDGIAKSMAIETGWLESDVTGAIGNPYYLEQANKSGFSALTGSKRSENGVYGSLTGACYWWSSTEFNANSARLVNLNYASPNAHAYLEIKSLVYLFVVLKINPYYNNNFSFL